MNHQLTTIARPYVAAVFAEAVAKNNLPTWRAFLDVASQITQNTAVQALLSAPHMNTAKLAQFYCDVLVNLLTPEQINFIRLLAENKRLIVLPEIALLFRLQQDEWNKITTVFVQSAVPLSDTWREKLIKKLSTKLNRQINLICEIDKSLLAGVIVTAGDYVIDGSVRGKLTRLKEAVSGVF